jgi:hypothetical protein
MKLTGIALVRCPCLAERSTVVKRAALDGNGHESDLPENVEQGRSKCMVMKRSARVRFNVPLCVLVHFASLFSIFSSLYKYTVFIV